MKTIRTRYAPSPTGYNHSAGLRTAIYNYLFAKKYNGEFFIRIEDTDQKRYNNKAEEYIKDSFEWIGIKPDDSPWNPNPKYGEYYQSKRDYSVYVEYLLENNFAYKAYDTPEELEQIGSKITNSISKNTNILIAADPEEKSNKIIKAKELKIEIISKDEFYKLVGK